MKLTKKLLLVLVAVVTVCVLTASSYLAFVHIVPYASIFLSSSIKVLVYIFISLITVSIISLSIVYVVVTVIGTITNVGTTDNTYEKSITNGDLTSWANQGVLLLNSTLTVRAHAAASHSGMGWEIFTDAVIRAVAQNRRHVVYMLWGSFAQKKAEFVSDKDNLILRR